MVIIAHHGGPIIMGIDGITPLNIMQYRYCGNKTVFNLRGSYHQNIYFTLKTSNDAGNFSIWKFWVCATCEKPTIERIDKVSSFSSTYTDDNSSSCIRRNLQKTTRKRIKGYFGS
jgi:hypothetical protein